MANQEQRSLNYAEMVSALKEYRRLLKQDQAEHPTDPFYQQEIDRVTEFLHGLAQYDD
jgi:hypothetical protein